MLGTQPSTWNVGCWDATHISTLDGWRGTLKSVVTAIIGGTEKGYWYRKGGVALVYRPGLAATVDRQGILGLYI